jgi:hypothetical protein
MLFRFLLFLVLFWLVYHFLRKWIVGPFRDGYQQERGGSAGAGRQREGKVTINYRPREKRQESTSRQVGEYVDYEEVDEKPDQQKEEKS